VKTETEIADEQAGFRQRSGTRDQITNLRILMHNAREHQQTLYMCFVVFRKAFDSISHDKLWVTMMEMGYHLHLIDLLAKLYRKQLAKVKEAGTLSEWFRVKKGDRQGCVLSPYSTLNLTTSPPLLSLTPFRSPLSPLNSHLWNQMLRPQGKASPWRQSWPGPCPSLPLPLQRDSLPPGLTQ